MKKGGWHPALTRAVTEAMDGIESKQITNEEAVECLAKLHDADTFVQLDAWRKLVAAYFILALTWARNRMPCAFADELVFMARWGILQAVRTYDPLNTTKTKFSTWLVYCVRTACDQHATLYALQVETRGACYGVAASPMIDDRAATTPDPAEECSDKELAMLARKAIAVLPVRQRVVASAVLLDGRTFVDVGKQLRISKQAAHDLYLTALATIREFPGIRRVYAEDVLAH